MWNNSVKKVVFANCCKVERDVSHREHSRQADYRALLHLLVLSDPSLDVFEFADKILHGMAQHPYHITNVERDVNTDKTLPKHTIDHRATEHTLLHLLATDSPPYDVVNDPGESC